MNAISTKKKSSSLPICPFFFLFHLVIPRHVWGPSYAHFEHIRDIEGCVCNIIIWHVWGPSYAHFEHIRDIEGYVCNIIIWHVM